MKRILAVVCMALAASFLLSSCGKKPSVESFRSVDNPTHPGTELTYSSQSAVESDGETVSIPVDFSLEGPWSFEKESGSEVIDSYPSETVAESELFEGANVVLQRVEGTSTSLIFYRKDESRQEQMGNALPGEGDEKEYVKMDPGVLTYKYPFRVGDTWQSESNVEGPGRSLVLEQSNEVLSRNSIEVPEGSYDDCFLIQTRTSFKMEDGQESSRIAYAWLVPGVGKVATVYSKVGETEEAFTEATYFNCLKGKTIVEAKD